MSILVSLPPSFHRLQTLCRGRTWAVQKKHSRKGSINRSSLFFLFLPPSRRLVGAGLNIFGSNISSSLQKTKAPEKLAQNASWLRGRNQEGVDAFFLFSSWDRAQTEVYVHLRSSHSVSAAFASALILSNSSQARCPTRAREAES